MGVGEQDVVGGLHVLAYWVLHDHTKLVLLVQELQLSWDSLPILLVEGFLARDQIEVLLMGNAQGNWLVPKAQELRLLAQVRELETKVLVDGATVFGRFGLAGYTGHREEEAGLPSIVILECEVGIAVWADCALKREVLFRLL